MIQYEIDQEAIVRLTEMMDTLLKYEPKDKLESWLFTKENLAYTLLVLQTLGSIYIDLEAMNKVSTKDMEAMHNLTKYMAVEWLKFAKDLAQIVPTKPKVVEQKKSFLKRLFN